MSENKEKKKFNFAFVGVSSSEGVPQPIEQVDKKKGMVTYGEDNRFPQYLYSLYNECSMLQSLCNGTADYVCGSSIEPQLKQEYEELIRKTVLDYIIFGAFCVQIRRNEFGGIVAYDYIDVQRVRLSEDEKEAYYSKNWDKYARDVRVYETYNGKPTQSNSLFYFKNPLSKGLYGLPIWSSALTEVQTLKEISQFHLASIQNGLHAPMVISFNNGIPTDEVKHEIEDKINTKFSGSKNAGKFLVNFNESKDNGLEIQSVPDENYDSKYLSLKENSTNALLISFRASAQLFGVSTQATGFSSIEYQNSFALFNATVIAPMQRQIERAYSEIGINMEFTPFHVEFEGENNVINQ